MRASTSRGSIMHVVSSNTANKTLATLAREVLVIPTMKDCKGEQLHWAEERRVEEMTKHTDRKLRDPRMESKGLGDSQLKEGLIETRLGMIRSDEGIRQLVASEASSTASSRKKDGTPNVSQEIDRVKSQYQSNNKHVKWRALGSRCKLKASGGSDAAPHRSPRAAAPRGPKAI